MSALGEAADGKRAMLRLVVAMIAAASLAVGGEPGLFVFKGSDPAKVWQAGEDTGACRDAPFPKAQQDAVFSFDGLGGIRASLAGIPQGQSGRGCMSYGTAGSHCTMQKSEIREIRFTAATSGCFFGPRDPRNVWAAPLWITPALWIPPQGRSGEIDFLERCGTDAGSGFALNYGNSRDADSDGTRPIPGQTNIVVPLNASQVSQRHTYVFSFDQAQDLIKTFVCPAGARQVSANCSQFAPIHKGYFRRTKQQDPRANVMHFVSDIWNSQGALAGGCTPSQQSLQNRACSYEVYDIRVRKDAPFSGACAVFNPAHLVE